MSTYDKSDECWDRTMPSPILLIFKHNQKNGINRPARYIPWR